MPFFQTSRTVSFTIVVTCDILVSISFLLAVLYLYFKSKELKARSDDTLVSDYALEIEGFPKSETSAHEVEDFLVGLGSGPIHEIEFGKIYGSTLREFQKLD